MLISILLNGVGLLLFALTQRSLRRRQQRAELANKRRLLLRVGAWLLVALAWLAAAHRLGPQLGSLFWFAEVGVAGIFVAVVLALQHAAMPVPASNGLASTRDR